MRNSTREAEFSFCVTNLDLYSGAIETLLRRRGFNTIEYHCLGLCAECMTGSVALLNNREVINPEIWLENNKHQQGRKAE
ncbi:hypothetical protein [Salibacterium aidingense]|uniref:hypothetical protein n=1 Tax=Salibacterium aidingense TaxID=384933 RepID=UPI003BDFB876